MKTWFGLKWTVILLAATLVAFESCKEQKTTTTDELVMNIEKPTDKKAVLPKKPLSEDFKKYWYAGEAEITSYKLEQARYGELRGGTAVMIYVTEPFLPEVQVKADGNNASNVQVLKLNATKNYLTGIYPYSIMSSTFYPVYDNQHAIKTSLSIQEWCGHVYAQLNNREQFEFTSHSYFEGEADQSTAFDKAHLENEIWNKIRINPADLPIGKIEIVPSLEFFRVRHTPVQAMPATATLETKDGISSYSIDYGAASRKLTINFTADFPYAVESWTDEFKSGYGSKAKVLVSKGTKMKMLKTPYWGQNSNSFVHLRDSLNL
ncbi:septum formation inhibitor Maf [uncultured Croceitalea sp.]|uniref:septum formation inhibitor Maf n=1 Tax=uncultured Croceitalea sp. TaxID=1798908 RepID=UPI0033068067